MAVLRGNLRMLTDPDKAPQSRAAAGCVSSHGDRRCRQIAARAESMYLLARGAQAGTPAQEAEHGGV